jgi:enoyl-CoA hydratase/carnithine racemase
MSIVSELNDNILYLYLDNSQQGSSFGLKEANDLSLAVKQDCKAIVLQSKSNRFFCSGGNLTDYVFLESRKQGIEINKIIRESLMKLYLKPVYKLAIVNGDCYGGGVELLSCFNSIIATPSVMFALWQRKMGLSFGWGGYERLLRRVNKHTLESLFYSTKTLNAQQALNIGLIDKIVLENDLEKQIYRNLKKELNFPLSPFQSMQAQIHYKEEKEFNKLWHSKEHLSALSLWSKKIKKY